LPTGDATATAREVPASIRRRLDPLGRAALQVAHAVADGAQPDPVVFVSRRGDSQRSLDLLSALAAGEPLSPTSFGLSVHNAIAAQYVMWQGQRGGYTALAAGREGVENALVEIAARIAGKPAVTALLVVYEAPVPAPYLRYRDEPDACFAWAMTLATPRPQAPRIRLSCTHGGAVAPAAPGAELPAALACFAALLRGDRGWNNRIDGRHWKWCLDP
jgi:hypothetical protein